VVLVVLGFFVLSCLGLLCFCWGGVECWVGVNLGREDGDVGERRDVRSEGQIRVFNI
jgi:hypothetical protein